MTSGLTNLILKNGEPNNDTKVIVDNISLAALECTS